MIHVSIPATVLKQIDMPEASDTFQRSVKGSLHLRPGLMEITEDELKFIQKEHPAVARVLTTHEVTARAEGDVPTPAAPVAAPATTADATREESGEPRRPAPKARGGSKPSED